MLVLIAQEFDQSFSVSVLWCHEVSSLSTISSRLFPERRSLETARASSQHLFSETGADFRD